jgi:hypothetical protein
MDTKPSGSCEGTVQQRPLYQQVLLYGRLAFIIISAFNVGKVGFAS